MESNIITLRNERDESFQTNYAFSSQLFNYTNKPFKYSIGNRELKLEAKKAIAFFAENGLCEACTDIFIYCNDNDPCQRYLRWDSEEYTFVSGEKGISFYPFSSKPLGSECDRHKITSCSLTLYFFRRYPKTYNPLFFNLSSKPYVIEIKKEWMKGIYIKSCTKEYVFLCGESKNCDVILDNTVSCEDYVYIRLHLGEHNCLRYILFLKYTSLDFSELMNKGLVFIIKDVHLGKPTLKVVSPEEAQLEQSKFEHKCTQEILQCLA